MRDELWPKVLATAIAGLVILNLLFALVAEAITSLACGARPSSTGPLSGTWLALSGDPTA